MPPFYNTLMAILTLQTLHTSSPGSGQVFSEVVYKRQFSPQYQEWMTVGAVTLLLILVPYFAWSSSAAKYGTVAPRRA